MNKLSLAWRARMALRPIRYSKHIVAEHLVCDVIMRKWRGGPGKTPDSSHMLSSGARCFLMFEAEFPPMRKYVGRDGELGDCYPGQGIDEMRHADEQLLAYAR